MNQNKNKSEDFFPEFAAASFISNKAIASVKVLFDQFPKYFQDTKIKRQFYIDLLLLFIDIYHRNGGGLIKCDKSIPSLETLDNRIGIIIGMCCSLTQHSSEFSFLQSIDLQFLGSSYGEFQNWSRQFEDIFDVKNALSLKFDSDQIVGFSYKGKNTLVINFIAKEIETLSIRENDLEKYIFLLSDLIAQFLCDPGFDSLLHINEK